MCSADGSTHTESNKLHRKVKHRYRPNLSPRQRPTAKARPDEAALAASAEARGATHRARPRSPSRLDTYVCVCVREWLTYLNQSWIPGSCGGHGFYREDAENVKTKHERAPGDIAVIHDAKRC